jgi:hypothetical protein
MQKNYPRLSLVVDVIIGIGVGLYFIFILADGDVEFQIIGAVLMVVFPLGGYLAYAMLTSVLQRSQQPVVLYRDGVGFQLFPFDRLIRRKAFIPTTDLRAVKKTWVMPNSNASQQRSSLTLGFVPVKGSMFIIGERSPEDIQRAVDYVQKEWPNVQVIDETGSNPQPRDVRATPGKARKVRGPPNGGAVPPKSR